MNRWNRRLCSNIISGLSVIAVSAATICSSAASSASVALRAASAADWLSHRSTRTRSTSCTPRARSSKAARRCGQEALGLQPAQSLARRCAADLQPLGDLVFGDAVAGLELVRNDRIADRLVGDFTEQQVRVVGAGHWMIVARLSGVSHPVPAQTTGT